VFKVKKRDTFCTISGQLGEIQNAKTTAYNPQSEIPEGPFFATSGEIPIG